jgi:hypothetical protein
MNIVSPPNRYANTLLLLLNNRATPSRTQALSRHSNEPDIPSNAMQLEEYNLPSPRTTSPSLRKDAGAQPLSNGQGGNDVRSLGTNTHASMHFEVRV